MSDRRLRLMPRTRVWFRIRPWERETVRVHGRWRHDRRRGTGHADRVAGATRAAAGASSKVSSGACVTRDAPGTVTRPAGLLDEDSPANRVAAFGSYLRGYLIDSALSASRTRLQALIAGSAAISSSLTLRCEWRLTPSAKFGACGPLVSQKQLQGRCVEGRYRFWAPGARSVTTQPGPGSAPLGLHRRRHVQFVGKITPFEETPIAHIPSRCGCSPPAPGCRSPVVPGRPRLSAPIDRVRAGVGDSNTGACCSMTTTEPGAFPGPAIQGTYANLPCAAELTGCRRDWASQVRPRPHHGRGHRRHLHRPTTPDRTPAELITGRFLATERPTQPCRAGPDRAMFTDPFTGRSPTMPSSRARRTLEGP